MDFVELLPAAFLIVRREEARGGGPKGGGGGGGGGGEAAGCDFDFGFEEFACFGRVDGDPKSSLNVSMIRGEKIGERQMFQSWKEWID